MIKHAMLGVALAGTLTYACAQENSAPKRAFKLPPSADLHYSIKARHKGFSISGEALTKWRAADGKYSLDTVTRATLFGTVLENKSTGTIDDYGIAPSQVYEKRIRKDPWTATFDRQRDRLSFSLSKQTYPLKGGEQDRTTAQWQLAAVARAAPEKFTPGSQWTFFVAGRRDAESWTFKVVKQETVRTGLGTVSAIHLSKLQSPDGQDQTIDLWLAPGQEWYPVRVRFADSEGELIEQTLDKIVKK
ncbi:MAG: DUF3108 domain-containing protein [Pseudomonadota bacterium]